MEIHRDPYDVSQVWVRNHHDGGWITLFWKHLSSMPMPFGELAWNHALAGLLGQGGNPTEDEIGQAAADLLDRAHRGPSSPQQTGAGTKASRRDRRIAARTRAAGPTLPAAAQLEIPDAPAIDDQAPEKAPQAHDVVPLGVLDARQEADTWW